jgi:hypothetical protein
MPDAMHVFFGVLSLYFVKLWVDLPGKDKPDKDENDSKVYYRYIYPVLAGLSLAVCVLAKPYGLVLGAPILYLLWQRFGLNLLKNYMVYIFAAIVLTPFLLWRWHINNYPEGMFGTTWLFNQGDIRFTGAYFRWLIYDRMNRLIFATGGFVLFFIGLLKFSKKEGLFYYIWLAAIGVFFVVIAKGNVTHDYYQLPLVPIGCVFMAKGVEFLWLLAKDKYQQVFHVVISFVLIALMVAFGWYEVRGFFNVNRPEIVAAGKFIDENLPQDAKVIAPYMSDPAFLYQTNRYGWTIGGGKIRDFKEKEGATHLAIVNFDDDQKYWLERCKKIAGEENVWAVVDLRQCEGE